MAQNNADFMSKRSADDNWPSWMWWAGGIFLLLAYCNYADRDDRPASPYATAGMTSRQALAYQDCMEHTRYSNLSDYTHSEMCRRSALGLDSPVECNTQLDGRANPTMCE